MTTAHLDQEPVRPKLLPEPPDGTRLAVRIREGTSWCRNCQPDWLVIHRDDDLGRAEYIVPAGEGSWFCDQAPAFPWSGIAPLIIEAFQLIPFGTPDGDAR